MMSATGINCGAVTATPLLVRLPAVGLVAMPTANRLFGGVSFGSVKPKSATAKT